MVRLPADGPWTIPESGIEHPFPVRPSVNTVKRIVRDGRRLVYGIWMVCREGEELEVERKHTTHYSHYDQQIEKTLQEPSVSQRLHANKEQCVPVMVTTRLDTNLTYNNCL